MKQLSSLIFRLLYHAKTSCSFPHRQLTDPQSQQEACAKRKATGKPNLVQGKQRALLS